MKIISIDIGIKNLAYVILQHDKNKENNSEFTILEWNIINLCNYIPSCCNHNCKKQAKYTKINQYFCKQHTKNSEYKIPTINTKNLNKQTIKTLMSYADDMNIEYEKKILKNDLIDLIKNELNDKYFYPIENISANNINLIDIGINLKNNLNELFNRIELSSIDMILLENQISPIANRMKTVQGMIAQYFINCGNYNIEFISATNKLKLFNETKKTSYSIRKKLGIQYTQQLLSKYSMLENLDYFNKHSKKDDLADSFLQGIYYLHTFNKLKIN